MSRPQTGCSECTSPFDRRAFLKGAGGAMVAGGVLPLLGALPGAYAAPTAQSTAETAVGRFYAALTESQRKQICFPFAHELRSKISANWHVTGPKIGDAFYTVEQRKLIDDIIRGVTSADGYERMQKQMEDDNGGVNAFSVAVFGDPESGKFEWELTGRHLTLRADGNSVEGAAFGGPIVYGHGEEDAKANLYHYQTQQTNKVFQALDAEQRKLALLSRAPREADVQLQGAQVKFPGIAVRSLSSDQQALVAETLKVLLAPYREEDVAEAMEVLQAGGGLGSLHMAFYEQGDLGNDREWDIWRVEGPSFVWHFRGAPHVHAYINIGMAKG